MNHTVPISEVLSRPWQKNWSGKEWLLTDAYLGRQYTSYMQTVLGVSLKEVLFISHEGFAYNYFVPENKEAFAAHLIAQAKAEPELIDHWIHELKRWTDTMVFVNQELQQKVSMSGDDFKRLFEVIYDYTVYHRVVKTIPDYLPPDLAEKYLPALTEARVYCEPAYENMDKTIHKFAQDVSKQTGIDASVTLAITPAQFEEYCVSGMLPSLETLERQYRNSVLYIRNGEIMHYSDPSEVASIEQALGATGEAREIKGVSAYPGIVRGTVRIVLHPSKATQFNEGDILMSMSTRPDFLPLFKKAGAVVTDAGSVLSHAAITAREMKKPCVIGTEKATKVFKDGDMVEVDANTGIVRKI